MRPITRLGVTKPVPKSHALHCHCGRLEGQVHPVQPANRCICFCRDCRAFANHLNHAGDVLDAAGGTEIIQVPPANVKITRGVEQLACLRLTEKGLLRWYSRCCNTPIGNTGPARNPSFVGLIHTCLDGTAEAIEASFGPVTMYVHARSAISVQVKDRGVLAGIVKILRFAARARLDGSYRLTPFFDQQTGLPVSAPTVLTEAQLRAAQSNT